MAFKANLSYFLSRTAFVTTHLVFVYWLLFVTNDPLNTGYVNTLDFPADQILPAKECTRTDHTAQFRNVWQFVVFWWLPHSGFSRTFVKNLLGLGPENPLDRPLFAFQAPFSWLATMMTWTPITNCSRFDIYEVNLYAYAIPFVICFIFLVELLGLFFLLPNHVFGTDRYRWYKTPPVSHALIIDFPYALVRHPAAAAFLWLYWIGIPSYNPNHILLATLWSIFIVTGTLLFEEGGLQVEFAEVYGKYSDKVGAFIPSMWSLKYTLGMQVEPWDAKPKEA